MTEATLILTCSNVITMDPRQPPASAVATLNLTRTSETTRHPAGNSLTPYNEQLTTPFPLCGDQLSVAS